MTNCASEVNLSAGSYFLLLCFLSIAHSFHRARECEYYVTDRVWMLAKVCFFSDWVSVM